MNFFRFFFNFATCRQKKKRNKANKMCKFISKRSVNIANAKSSKQSSHRISINGGSASIVCRTSFGRKEIVIDRNKLNSASQEALSQLR